MALQALGAPQASQHKTAQQYCLKGGSNPVCVLKVLPTCRSDQTTLSSKNTHTHFNSSAYDGKYSLVRQRRGWHCCHELVCLARRPFPLLSSVTCAERKTRVKNLKNPKRNTLSCSPTSLLGSNPSILSCFSTVQVKLGQIARQIARGSDHHPRFA